MNHVWKLKISSTRKGVANYQKESPIIITAQAHKQQNDKAGCSEIKLAGGKKTRNVTDNQIHKAAKNTSQTAELIKFVLSLEYLKPI